MLIGSWKVYFPDGSVPDDDIGTGDICAIVSGCDPMEVGAEVEVVKGGGAIAMPPPQVPMLEY